MDCPTDPDVLHYVCNSCVRRINESLGVRFQEIIIAPCTCITLSKIKYSTKELLALYYFILSLDLSHLSLLFLISAISCNKFFII